MTIDSDKAALRLRMRGVLAALGPDRGSHDAAVCRAILASDEYGSSKQLIAYKALTDEVGVEALIEAALVDSIPVFLPAMAAGQALEFRRWRRGDVLARGRSGVLEPCGGEPPAPLASLMLVPGRAFDLFGNRLGRGGGHYDRVLESLPTTTTTVGVAYSCQILDSVSVGPGDQSVSLVASESGMFVAGL